MGNVLNQLGQRRRHARLGAAMLVAVAVGSATTTVVGVANAEPASAACNAANPSATPEACAVLGLLASRPSTGIKHRIVSGQQVDVSDWAGGAVQNVNAGWKDHIEDLKAKTGWTPKIAGFDYAEYVREADRPACPDGNWVGTTAAEMTKFNADTKAAINAKLKQHVAAKGVATISWHTRNPWTRCGSSTAPGNNFADVYTSGTTANTNFRGELDRVAAALQELENAKVPVLFRPLHEMNASWFWWGNRSTSEFANLWNYVYDYLTTTKGLHNLLWVYSAASENAWSATPADRYYTDDYTRCIYGTNSSGRYYCKYEIKYRGTSRRVDVLGLDVYDDALKLGGYSSLAAKGKPLGLTEYGPTSESGNANFDQLMVKKVVVDQNLYPKVSFAVAWATVAGKPMALVDTKNAGPYLLDGAVVTREPTV